jgi:bla regulator protein BlaR1
MSEWMAGLGNHLWQTTAFAAVAWAVTLLLRKNQARVRYAVWLAASVKFLVPFSLLIALGGMLPRPQKTVAAPAIYTAMDNMALPFDEMPLESPASTHVSEARHGAPASVVALGVVWMCGVLAVLGMWGVRWHQVRATLRRAVRAHAGREWELLRGVEAEMSLRRPVALLLSRDLMEPGIFGIFRPSLIWPERLSERLDDAQITAILIHELAHTQRRDNLAAALHMVVEAAFWFHPLVWWMERRMVEERERACDEAVVARCSQPDVYAESLLKAVRFCVESPLTCVAGITGADLSKRVRSIMTAGICRKLTLGKKLLLLAAALPIAVVPIMLGQGRAAERIEAMAINAAPAPIQSAAHAMMAEAQPPSVPADPRTPLQEEMTLGPAFEVATIRPADPSDGRRSFGVQVDASGHYVVSAMPLSTIVQSAYIERYGNGNIGTDSTSPKWVNSDAFDVNAKVDQANMAGWDKMTSAQRMDLVRPMVRRLLAERFKLKLRTEMRDMPVYALVQAKGGTRMKEAPAPLAPLQGEAMAAAKIPSVNKGLAPGQTVCSTTTCDGAAVQVSRLIGMIRGGGWVDRVVIDQTGLKGYYDFSFTRPSTNFAANRPPENDLAQPFVQIGEELRLKFEPVKVPTMTYVIVSAEKPTLDGAEIHPQVILTPVSFQTSAKLATEASAAYVPTMTFDVASIRETHPIGPHEVNDSLSPHSSSFTGTNLTVSRLVGLAYGLNYSQISGGPDWFGSATFNVEAKADSATNAQLAKLNDERATLEKRHMLQALLADRFHLKVRVDSKESTIYALVVAKNGPKFHETKPDAVGADSSAGGQGPVMNQGVDADGLELIAHGITMKAFAGWLAVMQHTPVIDKTALSGKYDFTLHYFANKSGALSDDPSKSPPPIVAIQDQLGLKLDTTKGPVEMLVVDHVERPTAN